MSGIAGMYHTDGKPACSSVLEQMTDALAHRGPDGAGAWHAGPVGLGHRMLWTTPESLQETMPLASADGRYVLTADARIDNREALLARLSLRGRRGAALPDSALILAAYARWGAGCVAHLLGDFAFAVWDAQERTLFCARDPMGVRPFYYHLRPGRLFAFGSEVKAVLRLDGVPRTLDEVRIACYLARLIDDPGRTFYREVHTLPPAHAMTVRRDGTVHRHRYWTPDPDRELRLGSDADYAEGFLEIFQAAVRCRLRSAAPPGVMLSGGLDSSSVACVARDALRDAGRDPLQAFSATFPGLPEPLLQKSDERHYVEAVRAGGGIETSLLSLDAASPLAGLERTLWHLDAPYLASNVYLVTALYRAARAAGVRTVLDGAEGDLVVSHGGALLGELAASGRWGDFAREVLALTARAGVTAQGWFRHTGRHYLAHHAERGQWGLYFRGVRVIATRLGIPYRYLLRHCGLRPAVPDSVRRILGRAPRENRAAAPPLIAPRLAQQTDFHARLQALERRHAPSRYTAREAHWNSLITDGGSIAAILAETNHLAAACGIEARHPFYDVRLVTYCLALPPEQKLHDGWTRMVLRRAMEGILPDAVRWRTGKADLGPNFYRNLLRMEQQRLGRLVEDDLDVVAPYADADVLRAARHRDDVDTLWPALMLSEWLRIENAVKTEPLTGPAPIGILERQVLRS